MIAPGGGDSVRDPRSPAGAGVGPRALAKCTGGDCSGCDLLPALRCHQTPAAIVDFLLPVAVYFTACVGGMIAGGHWIALSVWSGMMLIFLLLTEYRIKVARK